MIYERLVLMRDLLHPEGSIYVHCDWRVNSYLRLALDEIFGRDRFRNEIAWKRKTGSSSQIGESTRRFGHDIDLLLFYSREEHPIFNMQYSDQDPEYIRKFYRHKDADGRIYRIADLANPAPRPTLRYEYKGYKPPKNGWAISLKKMEQWDAEGRLASRPPWMGESKERDTSKTSAESRSPISGTISVRLQLSLMSVSTTPHRSQKNSYAEF